MRKAQEQCGQRTFFSDLLERVETAGRGADVLLILGNVGDGIALQKVANAFWQLFKSGDHSYRDAFLAP